MDPRLVQVLEKALGTGEIGSLFIGQGRKMRQVFLAGTEVYLVDAGREIRFCPVPFVLDGSVIPQSELDVVLGRFGSSPKSLARLIEEDYELTDEQRHLLRTTETLEEALMVLEAGADRFVFEPGTVPEEVLLPEEDAPLGIPNADFLAAMRLRLRERGLIDQIFPHPEEMPVLTGAGSAERIQGRQWLFARVADLVDGFRDLRRIRKDSLFPPHLTEKLLAAAVRRGWVRKKRFPEFEHLRLEKLDAGQLDRLTNSLLAAIPMSVDEIPLRRILAAVLERRDDRTGLLGQLIVIGDQLTGRRDWPGALDVYRRAIAIAPRSTEACGRLARLLEHFADEALAEGNAEGARRHLEEALPLRAYDESIHLKIVRSHGDDDSGAARAAARLAGMLHQDDQGERSLRLLRLVLQSYPTSDVVRKTFINFLLDHGMAEQALQELEMLARELLARGHNSEARQIFEKIVRIDPDRVPKELRAKLRARPVRPAALRQPRRRRHPLPLAVLLSVVLVCGYQLWLWQRAGEIVRRAEAIEAEPVPLVGTHEHVALRARWREVIDEIDRLRAEHPVEVATLRIGERQETWLLALQELEHAAERHLRSLQVRAEAARDFGSVDEARQIYSELGRVAGNSYWSMIAREGLDALESRHSAAAELRARADEARRSGNLPETFRLLRELVDLYPSAEASAGVTLPVVVVSYPAGAEIELDGELVGRSPLSLELAPYKKIELQVYHPDHPERTVTIDDPRTHTIEVDLRPAPAAGRGEESSAAKGAPPGAPRPREWAPLWLVPAPKLGANH